MVRNFRHLTPKDLAHEIGEMVATDSPMATDVRLSLELGHPLSKELRKLIMAKIGERLTVHTAPIGRYVGQWDIDENVDGERLYILGDWVDSGSGPRREYAIHVVWNSDANGVEPDSLEVSAGSASDTCTLGTLNEVLTRYSQIED